MKTISIQEFKTNISKFEKKILNGEEFVVTHGQKKKNHLRPPSMLSRNQREGSWEY